jgi:hypothetical protein
MQLQAVANGAVANGAAASKNPVTRTPAVQNRTPEPVKKANVEPEQQLRKVTTEISLGSRNKMQNPQPQQRPNKEPATSFTPKGKDTEKLTYSVGNEKKSSGPIDYEKEYHFYKERCAKLEQVAKWLRDLKSKNQKLEEELLQYQKGTHNTNSNTEKIHELEKRYVAEIQKKNNHIRAFHSKMQEIKLENEVLREQITDQNKLIERLEDGFKMAMDQVDYLTQQFTPQTQQNSKSTIYEDDINYDDLDEATLMQLLAQTREALMDKRKSFQSDSYDDIDY